MALGRQGFASVTLLGKPLRAQLSERARMALAGRQAPLLAEMELFFSCLIRKQVRFRNACDETDAVAVDPNLLVRFRPVMTAVCGQNYEGDEPPLTDFPIARVQAFVPHWLQIDYRDRNWTGEFGFD